MHIEIPKMMRVDRNSILGWLVVKGLVVEVVWRVATKQRKANRFLDVADVVGWFYASNRTLVLMLVYAHLKFVSRDQC